MNDRQQAVAQNSMIEWLSDPSELGKAPNKIEYVSSFKYNEMTYYIFKFKKGLLGKWLVGVAGGFEGDDLEPCGHTYSDFQPFDPVTAQGDCTVMVQRIINFWKERAKMYQS